MKNFGIFQTSSLRIIGNCLVECKFHKSGKWLTIAMATAPSEFEIFKLLLMADMCMLLETETKRWFETKWFPKWNKWSTDLGIHVAIHTGFLSTNYTLGRNILSLFTLECETRSIRHWEVVGSSLPRSGSFYQFFLTFSVLFCRFSYY